MHISVLLNESIEYLNIKPNSIIVDLTLGYGGHSSEILKKIPDGFLYSFDQDERAIKEATKKLEKIRNNYKIINDNFVNLKKYIDEADGILFDLGVSSPQLDESERGFSFHKDAKLDMRMNEKNPLSAYNVVNEYPLEKLIQIFRDYGEEKFAVSIAKGIVKAREEKNIETTLELTEIIKENVPMKYRREKHPARKVFQAIRIEVNNELEVFESALKDALSKIKVGGRICVITFHSLEDKICKRIFKEVSTVPKEFKDLPVLPKEYEPKYKIIGNIAPTDEEVKENPRARSARLRIIERRM